MAITATSNASAEKPIRIVIVGAGAVGCFYGSRLHDSNRNILVSLICRSNYKAVASAGGVQMLTRSYGDYFFQPEYVFPSVDAAARPSPEHATSKASAVKVTWDYIVVTTKALPDLEDDSSRISELVRHSPGAAIVLIQNGVGVEAPYRKRFGGDIVILSGVTAVSAEQIEGGVVRQNLWTRLSVGPYTDGLGADEGEDNTSLAAKVRGHLTKSLNQKTQAFVDLLKAGGIKDADMYPERDLQTVRWHKIAINAAMNPSAVLAYGPTSGALSSDPDVKEHLKACMAEVFAGTEAVLGRAFPPAHMKLADADKLLASIARNAGGRPSMVGDWERGATMELEVILGNPIRAAKAHGVEMPRLQSMYALLKMAQKVKQEQKANAKL